MSSQQKVFWWAIGSAIIAVIGSFGPWAKVLGVISVSGTDGDGWIVIVLALVAAGLILLRQQRGSGLWAVAVAFVAAAIAAGTAIYDWNNLNGVADASGLVDAGWGIYLAALGSVSLALACIGLLLEGRSRAQAAPITPAAEPAPDGPATETPPDTPPSATSE